MSDKWHEEHLPYPMMQACQAIEAVYLLQPRSPAHDEKLSESQRSEQQTRELPGSENEALLGAGMHRVHPSRNADRRMNGSQPGQRAE